MPGRLHQAANRHDAVTRRTMARLAERVANGEIVSVAGRAIGLTSNETAASWLRIKRELGAQAR